jgi:hypothetical protein
LREGVRRYIAWLDAQPEVTPVRAAPRRTPLRTFVGRMAHAVSEPATVGFAALVAVAAAIVAVILGTSEESQAATLTFTGLALMLPVWSLTMTPWPREHRRLHSVLIAAFAVAAVGILGLLSSRSPSPFHVRRVLLWLALCGSVASALQVLPRRVAAASRD